MADPSSLPQVRLQPHTPAWYDRLATLQEGYVYPWRSRLPKWHGEDVYLALVKEHVRPSLDVLDVACGHGEIALTLAPRCHQILGYDRSVPWIAMARAAAIERGLDNAAFICHDSTPAANRGMARLPAADASIDVLICSKGPFHWIEDARRVARPGATVIMVIPSPTRELPWTGLLPEPLRWTDPEDGNPLWARDKISELLARGGLTIDRYWSFVVPEIFSTPHDVYQWRAWGYTSDEVPSFDEVRPTLEHIFAEYGNSHGLAVPHGRFLWMAMVPE